MPGDEAGSIGQMGVTGFTLGSGGGGGALDPCLGIGVPPRV